MPEVPSRMFGEVGAYRLQSAACQLRIEELRWIKDGDVTTLRDVVGDLERYEPTRRLTRAALAAAPVELSTVTLAAELRRLEASRLLLNRALREAVLAAGLSLSEIAQRCGRTKRNRRGEVSGETSWLARKVGLAPDSTLGRISPWVREDVLGLVAVHGLGLNPRDVEVDVDEDLDIEDHWCPTCVELVTTGTDAVCPWCETTLGTVPVEVAA